MFGEILAKLRLSRKWTQDDLARQLNLSRSTIAGYESKGRIPREDILVAIADLFDVSLDFLMNRDSLSKNQQPIALNHKELPGDDSPRDEQQWKTLAQTLTEVMKMQAENDRLRIEKVDAVAQQNLQRILDRLDRADNALKTGEKRDAAKSLVNE